MKNSTKRIAYIAVGVALMTVCSWIAVPTVIPFTLQTFAIYFTLLFLGGRDGFFAVLIYLLLGAVGLPVFSAFGSGIGKIIGPTGGFLVGFVPLAAIYWCGTKVFPDKKLVRMLLLAVGTLLCYALGTFWYTYWLQQKGGGTLLSVLTVCVFPFILPDAVKMFLAFWIAERLKKPKTRNKHEINTK